MWQIEPVPGTNLFRLRNRWQSDNYLHMENGGLELGPIDPGWFSTMWWALD